MTDGVENVQWHRTPKSARSDLKYSGLAKNPVPAWSIRTTHGETVLRQSAEFTRARMLPKALSLFDSLAGFRDVDAKFQEAARPNDFGWTLEMRFQLHLAYAFFLAKNGHESEAKEMMSRWLNRNSNSFRPETLERISELFKNAVDSPYFAQ